MHSSMQMKTSCVGRLMKRTDRLRLRDADSSAVPIQWPFSGLHGPPVPLLRSPGVGLVYCRCDNGSILSPVTFFFLSSSSWICGCGHQSGTSPERSPHLVITAEPQLCNKSLHPLQTHIDRILNLINHVPVLSYQEIEFA